jgi:hypothetical protein
VALVLAATLLAACGGGSGSASSTNASTSSGAATTTAGAAGTANRNSAAFTKYAACLKKNGVTLPARRSGGAPGAGNGQPSTNGSRGPPPGQGAGNPKFQKAQAACASLRPAGAGRGFAGGQGGNSAANAAFRNCLKLKGVTASTSRTSATFKKAMTACASLRPQPQQATTTTTGTS